jgi:hypothetical protein
VVPGLYGPVYKGIFSDICLLFSASDFPILIDSAQMNDFCSLILMTFHA